MSPLLTILNCSPVIMTLAMTMDSDSFYGTSVPADRQVRVAHVVDFLQSKTKHALVSRTLRRACAMKIGPTDYILARIVPTSVEAEELVYDPQHMYQRISTDKNGVVDPLAAWWPFP